MAPVRTMAPAQESNLKEIEKRAYMSYHQDGLLDIIIGAYILGFALGIYVDIIWDLGGMGSVMPAILVAVILPLWILAKRRITMPRIGFVKFGPTHTTRLMGIFVGLVIMGLAFSVAFTLTLTQGAPPLWITTIIQYGTIVIGLAALAICVLFGYTMGLSRLYLYGLLTLILFVASHFAGIFFGYILLILGIAITAAGFYLLVSFVRRYPLRGDKAIGD